ncbi:PREDICTED: uncharacterized protein LOC105511358 [Colobus angolensis palliatus]|uniref:uncharacterized protein LOC105511358 n=1 Tax=Colobus angolensis palliatus TaxID=336983 RepID=UPI0005F56B0D|nr:PREDICTED: uncharacterized protein LOC105511358 [Colobus angolensis palliatus]
MGGRERGGGRRWLGARSAQLTLGGPASRGAGSAVRPQRPRSANSCRPWRSVLGSRYHSRPRRSSGRRGHVTVRDVRAAAEPAKLKLVQGIVNKGTRDSQLRSALCASILRAPRALRSARRPPAQAGAGPWGPGSGCRQILQDLTSKETSGGAVGGGEDVWPVHAECKAA